MSLSDFASVGSLVGSLAVALSLVYLGVQTHQAAKHTRALLQQGRASRMTDFIMAASEADRVAAMLETMTGTPPTPELIKQTQVRMFFQACFVGWADVFEQHQIGLLSGDQLADLRANISGILHPVPARQFWAQWKAIRPGTHAAFKAWVEDATDAAVPPGTA